MSWALAFHPDVEADVREAFNYYENNQPGLGERFLAAVDVSYARLESNPFIRQLIWQTVRRDMTNDFPYGVFYQIYADRVEVIAVHHLRRNPAAWQARATIP